jgi:hypothetical protein
MRIPGTMSETWAERWQAAARRGNYPFEGLPFAEVAAADVLPVFDSGDSEHAEADFVIAHGLNRLARFPCVNSRAKRDAYRSAQDCILPFGL